MDATLLGAVEHPERFALSRAAVSVGALGELYGSAEVVLDDPAAFLDGVDAVAIAVTMAELCLVDAHGWNARHLDALRVRSVLLDAGQAPQPGSEPLPLAVRRRDVVWDRRESVSSFGCRIGRVLVQVQIAHVAGASASGARTYGDPADRIGPAGRRHTALLGGLRSTAALAQTLLDGTEQEGAGPEDEPSRAAREPAWLLDAAVHRAGIDDFPFDALGPGGDIELVRRGGQLWRAATATIWNDDLAVRSRVGRS